MKKEYVAPRIEAVDLQSEGLLAASTYRQTLERDDFYEEDYTGNGLWYE